MCKLLLILLALLTLTIPVHASEPANPADPAMVAALLPGYTFIEGIDDDPVLRLLMRNPADELVFVGGVKKDGVWRFTESTPLPAGTILGVENFTHSLGIPNGTYYDALSVRPYADGTWGVSMFYPDAAGLFNLWRYVISDESHGLVYDPIGDHPWSDVTVIDWTALPQSYEEAVSRIDTTNWAVVSNPNPEDRLHLRTSPDRSAASLGKYYNRTPVRIREYGDTWCAVTVCGLDGYMMTGYLAFGKDMDTVDYAGPWLDFKEELTAHRLYLSPSGDSAYRDCANDTFFIMGVAGDFYHVWLPYTEEYGYVRMDDLWPGNG